MKPWPATERPWRARAAEDVPAESLRSPGATVTLLDTWLERFLPPAAAVPESLHRAMRHAVFSGGRRLRPQWLLQVAQACGAGKTELALSLRAACAIKLVHIASLVHDDLPCFDDASERRGRPTVHVLAGEPTAVLTGDALLTQSFEILASAPRPLAMRALRLVRMLARATGSCAGLIGGQGLEQEVAQYEIGANAFCPAEFIERYHSMKTGVLFGVAAEMAAVAAGATTTAEWGAVGQLFGKWYQLAHDLTEVQSRIAAAHGSACKGAPLGPPNAVLSRGEAAVRAQLQAVLAEIRKRVLTLAVQPEPLIAFLDVLPAHLPRASVTLAA